MTHQDRIDRIARFPQELTATVEALDEEQLDTPYGPGKWTVRQLVHHLADSHMNAFIRMKLIITEDNPTLKTYEQTDWAETADGNTGPIIPSISILHGLHFRWCILLNSLDESAWSRTANHPELGPVSLEKMLEVYYDHCDNHLKHIAQLTESKGW